MAFLETITHIFIPGQSNNHKARIIHSTSLVGFTLLIILIQVFLSFFSLSSPGILGYAANISIEQVISLTNEQRIMNGLPPLDYSETLSKAALTKGSDMLVKNYWAHVSPDGTEPWVFFTNSNYEYRFAGENLARDFPDAQSAVNAWMASSTHKENILSPKYKEIGVAVVEGELNGVDSTIIVQFFGTKLSDQVPVVPVARAGETPPQALSTEGSVVSKSTTVSGWGKGIKVAPFDFSKTASFSIVFFLIGAMMVDAVFILRRGLYRVGSRPFAQISFLGMVLAIILIIRAGQIL